jgi:hypothetical protein
MMRLLAIFGSAAILGLAALAALAGPPAATLADGPVITYMFPKDGDVLADKPEVIQMCFARPVNNRDKDKGGDFDFFLVPPDKSGVGMRIVFQPDGYGLAIYPNLADKPGPGQWTFRYRVTDYTTKEPTEGQITFTVKPGGSPILRATPPPCMGDMTPGPTLIPVGVTPTSTPTASPSPGSESNGGPDVLELALLTLAAVAGATVLGFVGYAVRHKVGFWLHRPPPREPGEGGEHH